MRKFTRLIGVVLIVVGVALLAYNFIPNFVINQQSADNQEMLENVSADELNSNAESTGEIDFSSIDDISPDAALNTENIDPDLLVGQLVIPSIDLNLPIYKSLTNTTLISGAAVMKHDQTMGEGNYAIAGHYTHGDTLFGSLGELEEGDLIRITDKDQIYEYEFSSYEVVPATALHMIEDGQAQEHEAPIVSLMRCYYVDYQKQPGREFFIGELVAQYDYSPDLLFAE